MSLLLILEDFPGLGINGASQDQSLLQMKGVVIMCDLSRMNIGIKGC